MGVKMGENDGDVHVENSTVHLVNNQVAVSWALLALLDHLLKQLCTAHLQGPLKVEYCTHRCFGISLYCWI